MEQEVTRCAENIVHSVKIVYGTRQRLVGLDVLLVGVKLRLHTLIVEFQRLLFGELGGSFVRIDDFKGICGCLSVFIGTDNALRHDHAVGLRIPIKGHIVTLAGAYKAVRCALVSSTW